MYQQLPILSLPSPFVPSLFQVNNLSNENRRLKEKLSLIATQVKALPGGASLAASASELTTSSRTKTLPLTGLATRTFYYQNNLFLRTCYCHNQQDIRSPMSDSQISVQIKEMCAYSWYQHSNLQIIGIFQTSESWIDKDLKSACFLISDGPDSFEDLTAKFHPSYRDNTIDGYEEVIVLFLLV